MKRLNRRRGIAILYISHDVASAGSLCHRVAILHEGAVVECDSIDEAFLNPRSGYTKRLISAIPRLPELRNANSLMAVDEGR